jgi:hypothetical protein
MLQLHGQIFLRSEDVSQNDTGGTRFSVITPRTFGVQFMPKIVGTLIVVVLLSTTGVTQVNAAGWSGGDSSPLRSSFSQGFTLTKVWSRVNDR